MDISKVREFAVSDSNAWNRGFEEWTINPEGLILRSQGHMDLENYARQLSGESP